MNADPVQIYAEHDHFAFRILFAGRDVALWDELEPLTEGMHGARMEISRAASCDDALSLLKEGGVDLCLAAEHLQGGRACELIRKAVAGTCSVPIIFVAENEGDVVHEAMEAGAVDYLIRGQLTLPLLERSFRYAIERRHMEEEMGMLLVAAGEATNAKTQFMSTVTHEFKTPLNAIIGMIDLVLDSDLTHKQHENLMLARFSADSLLRLMINVIDFSSLEQGKIALDNKFFPLRKFLAKTLLPLRVAAERKSLQLNVRVDPNVPEMLYGDPERLSQIIGHLLNNAVKFTDEGEISLSVAVKASTETVTTLQWMVGDTGTGIPKERIERMFQGFTQMDASTTRKHGGLGLGLSIVRNLVSLLGGKIWVESEPDRGTRFHFTTQSTVPLGYHCSSRAETPPVEPTVSAKEKARRLLVAEDSLVNQMVLTEALEKAGYEVTVVDDGRKAVEEAFSDGYGLILMDLQMPLMDGYEAAVLIREREAREGVCRVPIIALTGSEFRQDRERCDAAGMDGYLTKPLDQKALVKAIRAHLGPSEPEPVFSVRHLDVKEVLAILGGNARLLCELVEHFLREGQEQLQNIRRGALSNDEELIEQSAHKLKGMAVNIGATQVADDAFRIQLAVRRGDLSTSLPTVDNIERILAEIRLDLSMNAAHIRKGEVNEDSHCGR